MIEVDFEIMGKEWKLIVLKKKKYKRKNGKKSVGITNGDERTIEISTESLCFPTVVHELVHAYFAELCISTIKLKNEDLEEVFAELMANYGYELLKLADTLLDSVEAAIEPEPKKEEIN